MSRTIEKVAVIGSGVMGAGIVAHCANAGCEVLLLDIVSKDEQDRSALARNAIQMMHKSNPEMLMHKRNARRIKPGNIEDDLEQLRDFDWVVEVIIENLGNQRKPIFKTIKTHRSEHNSLIEHLYSTENGIDC